MKNLFDHELHRTDKSGIARKNIIKHKGVQPKGLFDEQFI